VCPPGAARRPVLFRPGAEHSKALPPPQRSTRHLSRRTLACAVALLPALAGCSAGDASLAANPQLTHYSWGTAFTSTNPKVSFPLPLGWKLVDPKAPGLEPNTVRLQSAAGTCQLLLSRGPAGEPPQNTLEALRQAMAKDGRPVQEKGRQQVGNLQAQRLDVDFGKGLTEQVYTMQTGSWLLTLITVRSQRCGTEFDDTLRGFRA
jgi:hypothetical protein